jgi:hypothetical protein
MNRLTVGICSVCQQASDQGSIEVPMAPGRAIPNMDPLPPAPP